MERSRRRSRSIVVAAGAAVVAVAIAALAWSGLSSVDYPTEHDEDAPPTIRYDTDSVESRVQSMVDGAIALYDSDGEGAFGTITPATPPYDHRIYQFVLDSATLETVADGVFPDLEERGDAWVAYISTNPETGMEETKRSWLAIRDGLIFGTDTTHPMPWASGSAMQGRDDDPAATYWM